MLSALATIIILASWNIILERLVQARKAYIHMHRYIIRCLTHGTHTRLYCPIETGTY